MELFRLHAYAVTPSRLTEGQEGIVGGKVTLSAELTATILKTIGTAKFENKTSVTFISDPGSRTNEIRDLVMSYGFAHGNEANTSARGLAIALANTMDNRSGQCLFVVAAQRRGSDRTVTLWTFPRDQAFQFQSKKDEASIDILNDVFSQSSRLRKAASFGGKNNRTSFLTGRVLDFQTQRLTRDAADFWIVNFLQCQPTMSPEAGTRMLAKYLRAAFEESTDNKERECLMTAAIAVRTMPRRNRSLVKFADEHLVDGAKTLFLDKIPNDESAVAEFEFSRDVFDETLKFAVFGLDTGVIVSSPFGQLGDTVKISGDAKKHLKCEGNIVSEKLRTKNA